MKPCNYIKKRLQHPSFPVSIAKILRAPILKDICKRLLLTTVTLALNRLKDIKKIVPRFLIREDQDFFFFLGFLSRRFTIHRRAGEGGVYLFNSSLPLPPASQTLRRISRVIISESSPLCIASSWTRTGNLWFPSASR